MSIMQQVNSQLHFDFYNHPTGIQANVCNAVAIISMEMTYKCVNISGKKLKELHHVLNQPQKHLDWDVSLNHLLEDCKTSIRRTCTDIELATLRPVYDAQSNEIYTQLLQKLRKKSK